MMPKSIACTAIVGVLSLVTSLPMAVAAPGKYTAAGAPSNPQVVVEWNKYYDHAQVTQIVQQLAKAHPERCRLETLGKSHGGREMWLLTITNFANKPPQHKPAFWIDGNIHANEVQATEVALYIAWYLLEMYGQSEFLSGLVDDKVFYVMPMMSPDGRDAHFYEPHTVHTPRTGMRPRDDDSDGLFDEDGPNDLDGDGHITRMRVADPWGRWKPHAKYPDLLEECEPNERGSYTELRNEGFDADGDGEVNEDGPGFYDPNRQFPWSWEPNYVDRGDRYPLSVLENRMVAEAIMQRPHIAAAQSFHNTAGAITRGPGNVDEDYEDEDKQLFDSLMDSGVKLLPGYKAVKFGDHLYACYGCEDDFFYYLMGSMCFVNELFTPYNFFHEPKDNGKSYFGTPAERFRLNEQILFGTGVVPWQLVEHPTFGTIEVGGLKKNWLRHPPSFLLEEECHRHMAFVLHHADQMPLLDINDVRVVPRDDNTAEVFATIANRRMMPSRLAWSIKHSIHPPDRVTLSGDNLRVLAGFTADKPVGPYAAQQRKPQTLKFDAVPGMSARYVRWIVAGDGNYQITVSSTKGGTVTVPVTPK
jgi:hypothetical protein